MAYKTIDGITSSIIPFYLQDGTLFVLLGRRGPKSKAFANSWALAGGFLNPGTESLEQCAARELKEETGDDWSSHPAHQKHWARNRQPVENSLIPPA